MRVNTGSFWKVALKGFPYSSSSVRESMSNRLLIIGPSHYCEKSRWALERAGIVFSEEGHPPFLHILPVKRAGGIRTTPVLVTPNKVLNDSIDISRWISKQPNIKWNPLGDTEEETNRIVALETLFGGKLGKLSRLFTYYHLLPHKNLVMKCMETSTPKSEQQWFSLGYPLFSFLMKKSMKINKQSANRAYEKLKEIMQEYERMADGDYFVGSRLTIADIAFASLAGPLVLPDQYGSIVPTLDEIPPTLYDIVQEFRRMKAGKRVLRLYEQFRESNTQYGVLK